MLRVLFFLFLLALPAGAQFVPLTLAGQQHGAPAGIAVRQEASTSCPNVATCTLAFASGVASGDLLIYAVASFNTITATTDSNSNTIANAVAYVHYQGERIDYVSSANAGTTSVTANSSSGVIHLHIWEISGLLGTFDQSGTANTTSASLTVTTSSATTAANELVFGFFGNGAANVTITPGAGFSPSTQSSDPVDDSSALSEVKIVSATGTQTATASLATGSLVDEIVVTFK
jgi:hypothetical protein